MRSNSHKQGWLLVVGAIAMVSSNVFARDDIKFQLQPRLCTLKAAEKSCNTTVSARWSSSTKESLCVIIVQRPNIKRCWEDYTDGEYRIELEFDDDLTFELRDIRSEQVLSAQTLKVIREAIEYRRKRRQPWSILY